jgi:ABC-type nickel/cobalt efflux system permease component RcnA
MLAAAGIGVLVFKIAIPEGLATALELAVGAMLVILGGHVLWRIVRDRFHLHVHEHEGERHLHWHSHRHGPDHRHEHRGHPEYRSLLVGMVHGLAGSAPLTVLVLSFAYTGRRFARANLALRLLAGLASLGIGGAILYEMGFRSGPVM